MYIYKITNKNNNKIYVGQTIQKNPKMRWYNHLADARKGKKSYLYDSMRKHGVENFVWELIDKADSVEELNNKEQFWLDFYRQITIVYNIREAGNNKIHSPLSIKKMQESQKLAHARRRAEGRSGGWKRIDGGPMKGKPHPKKGKPSKKWTEESKENLRQIKLLATYCRGRTWKIIDGKRVWMDK